MSLLTISQEELFEEIRNLPQESLGELRRYIEFLQFKSRSNEDQKKSVRPNNILDLEGILEGYDFSPEFIAEARKEMWRGFGEEP